MKSLLKRIIPKRLLALILPVYHFSLALLGAVYYRFPSKHLVVIGVTGTKGKTSTTEILNNILEEAGHNTAVLGTLRFKVGEKNSRNLKKMTMPGRFFVQKFLREAVNAGCSHAIIEMTSEGAKQFRQRFIDMDALIFTNLSPEHIESHGSYEKYRDAKLSIARTLARSTKNKRYMVANNDDKEAGLFLSLKGVIPVPFSKNDTESLVSTDSHISFDWKGVYICSPLPGLFNAYNIIAAASCADALGVNKEVIVRGIARTTIIEGRAERVIAGQNYPVVVDYAHTPDSLEALYHAFRGYDMVCILGNTGGGRDKWKRPIMGHIAETYCKEIILTNEDPYDEDPAAILEEMKIGIKTTVPEIVIDRREAIARGIVAAKKYEKPAILITGKGTDPYIMGPNGSKLVWDDRVVAKEEIERSLT